jgi:hypothetical protein
MKTGRSIIWDVVSIICEDATQPLDFDYNGYWAVPTSNLYGNGDSSELLKTTTSDGFSDGVHEVSLAAALPYQVGPFGNYYLPNSTLLYGAGSQTPAAAGLYHYTTRVDQLKEGRDTAKADINIGLHYIAANSTGQPDDADLDGIPDYVENWHGDGDTGQNRIHTADETDWNLAQTISGTTDKDNRVLAADVRKWDTDGGSGLRLDIFPLSQPVYPQADRADGSARVVG